MDFAEFLAQFRVLFPEFTTTSEATLEIYYNQTLAIFGVCDFAQLYLAAHLIQLDQTNGVGTTGGSIDGGNGEHTTEKVGDLQVVLKSGTERDRDVYFATTPYGRRYLAFRNACPSFGFSPRIYSGCPVSVKNI